ncbi:SDR family NAD(P)-dependent oxidoreductase [Phenylobacterium montanum]|uniref:D-xylose 1-dehydrogenase n=1 Tax=Phenylobacterium montanum TaxID=2823693 RepID=A0A975IWN2_9CAUL|nr:glucose 1-dehydrogenase [Caulobacter sp. S6]QUD90257.1 glucose 1-dehydrogenase [Caulobacter sp. S6]
MRLLAEKIVFVTGGSSGIGRAICLAAAQAGARLVINADLRESPREGGASTHELVRQAGADALFAEVDVSNRRSVEAALGQAEAAGGADVVVCNAGVALVEDLLALSEDAYRRIVAVNIDGAFFTAQAGARQMVRLGKAGSIILMSSMGGIRGAAATPVYSSTKAALRLMAASMADALGPQAIRVNAICPGVIDTELASIQGPNFREAMAGMVQRTPLRRSGMPSEIADVAVWLASDRASFVSGASIPVDGGLSAVL